MYYNNEDDLRCNVSPSPYVRRNTHYFMFSDAWISFASLRITHWKLDHVHRYAQALRTQSTGKSGERTARRRCRYNCRFVHFGWFSKAKGFQNEALTRAKGAGVCKRRDRATRKRGTKRERKRGRTSLDCGKIAFSHYDEIKVPSRIAVPSCFFGAILGPTSYIRTAINPRRSHGVPKSTVPRGYLRCKQKVRLCAKDRGTIPVNNLFFLRTCARTNNLPSRMSNLCFNGEKKNLLPSERNLFCPGANESPSPFPLFMRY